jgi:hypothetical protein
MSRPLDSYNSLTDEYLVDYFNNKRIRKHLRQMGLVSYLFQFQQKLQII